MSHKIMKIAYWGAVATLITLILCSCNAGTTRDQQLVQLYRQAVPAVVMISGDKQGDWDEEIYGVATGFFVGKNHVLTNAHVANIIVDGTIKLRLWNGETISAKKVAIDNHYDLALLAVDPNDVKFYTIPLLNLETLPQIGEKIFIIGSPCLYYNTMTAGIFSRGTTIGGIPLKNVWDCEVYLIDAGVEGGNSGSPALNTDLGVIGIVTGYCGKLTVVIPSYSICAFLKEHNGY